MSIAAYITIALAVAAAAFVQGTIGMGFAIIVAPTLAWVAPDLVPVCLLVLMIPLNVYVAWRERTALDRAGAGWITVGRVLGTLPGVWLLAALSARYLAVLVGAVTVLAAITTLFTPSFRQRERAALPQGS